LSHHCSAMLRMAKAARVLAALRVELFFDEEAGNWHYRVPALHINGGGTASRKKAERDCLSALLAPAWPNPVLKSHGC
jgi:hypothetical protein